MYSEYRQFVSVEITREISSFIYSNIFRVGVRCQVEKGNVLNGFVCGCVNFCIHTYFIICVMLAYLSKQTI